MIIRFFQDLLGFILGILQKLFSLKFITWIFLIVVIISGMFGYRGAKLTNNILEVILLLVLLTLFSDLSEFNFWGLWGKKSEQQLRDLEEENEPSLGKPRKADVAKREIAEAQPLQLMDNLEGNFLKLAFEIERLLRVLATVALVETVPPTVSQAQLAKKLREKDVLTDVGVKQLEAIRWLRNILVHGRANEINRPTLETGFQIATTLYNEIFNFLNPENPEK